MPSVTFAASSISSVLLLDPSPSDTYPLSLHDALPIYRRHADLGEDLPVADGGGEEVLEQVGRRALALADVAPDRHHRRRRRGRSEEHTSEIQSRLHLVCRLLLEKKNGSQDAMIADLRT